MKKLLALILIVALCLCCLASCEHRHTYGELKGYEEGHCKPYTCGCPYPIVLDDHIDADENDICDVCGYEYIFIFKLIADGSGYELDSVGAGYQGGDITIPSEYKGLPVVEIGCDAFKSNKKLTSVIIPDSVTLIGDGAFGNQTSLVSVNVGENVVTIGVGAFESCTSLKTITIPASIENMRSLVFNGNNMADIYFGVSAPGEDWDENWAEGLNEDVTIHWAEVESGIVQLRDILQKLPYGYNVEGLIEKYNFYEGQEYYFVNNSEDYCAFLSDIGVPHEGAFDTLFEEKVMLCYLRCVSGSADFIPVEYFYNYDTNEIDRKTIYQPDDNVGFPAVEICWCVDLVEVPIDIFERMSKDS